MLMRVVTGITDETVCFNAIMAVKFSTTGTREYSEEGGVGRIHFLKYSQ